MKVRLLCVVISLLFLVGCANGKSEIKSLGDMTFTVDISYKDDNYKCNGTIINNKLTLEIQEPSSIRGLKITFNEEEILIEHLGLRENIPIEKFPENSPLMLFNSAILQIENGDLDASDKRNYKVRGEIENEKFEFVLSPAFLPISVDILNLDFKAIFSNITVAKTP